MRILLVLHNFIPEPLFGAETACIAQMQALLSLDCELGLFYAGNALPKSDQLKALGLEKLRLYPVSYWPTKAQVLLSIRKPHVEHAFAKALQDYHPDIIVFHHLVRLSLQLPLIAKRANIPAVYVLHDYYWLCPSYSLCAWDADVCLKASPGRCAECLYRSRYQTKMPPGLATFGALLIHWRNRVVQQALRHIALFITPSIALIEQMAIRGIRLKPFVVIRNGQASVPKVLAKIEHQQVRFGYLGSIHRKKRDSCFAGSVSR